MSYNQLMNDSSTNTSCAVTDHAASKPCGRCPCGLASGLINGLYYLGLGTWFGAIVMLAIGAATTFQTVRSFEPSLHVSPWNHPELAIKGPSILAGAVVGASLKGLKIVQIICAIVVIAALLAQHTLFRQYLTRQTLSVRNGIRLLLVAIPVSMLLLNIFWITPEVLRLRDKMWDINQPVAVREQAKMDFDRFHKHSERTTAFTAFALAGCVLVSSLVLSNVTRRKVETLS